MDVLAKQHYVIKFCVRLKKNTVETILLLQAAFGNKVLGMSMIKRWHKMFLNGRESILFELLVGKPKTVCMVMNKDCRQSVQALAIELKISWESFCQILLGMKQVCSAWVSHFLRMDEIQVRFHTCNENLVMITNEPDFLT